VIARLISLALAGCLFVPCVVAAPADEPVGNAAPNYSSNYTESTRAIPYAAGTTPEDDGRPGEYYFRLGASAFQHKDYAHAIKMYEVAASWAHKPAQFDLGVMYARGQGVPVDLPRAMAWMALAAERDDKEYVEAKEVVYSAMSKEQFAQANVLWRELKKTYGDDVAMARAKARWAEVRNNATGTHVGSSAGHLYVGSPSPRTHLLPPPDGGPLGDGHLGDMAAGMIPGDIVDGSTAYRQLRESNDPYDPKFKRPEIGVATVEPLQPVKNEKPGESAKSAADDPPAR
jgi:Sel1 repeat